MEIPSDTSNVQPYGSQSGIKLASKNDSAQRTPPKAESNVAVEVDQRHAQSVDAAIELAQQRERINKAERAKMVEQMNDFISSINTGLSFRLDEESGRDVVTIYEASSGDIIRQIPEEEMLEVLRRLRDQNSRYSSGLLIDKV
ncbi:flagellar protein FlaG [Vibrio profundum]|uniref:flagellar protein FlaG n=1 Tax=Vibrio profundum TaxID=2910247 RepID=UPI003D151264